MLTEVSAEMLAQTVEAVFLTMMDLEVSPSEKPWAPSHDQLTSAVHLSGDWNGALLFECDRRAGMPIHRPVSFDGSAGDGERRRA